MQRKRSRIAVLLLTGLAFLVCAAAPTAQAQPRKRPKPASQADVDRLEKRIEDQQKQIDKLVKLQQAYLASLTAILDGKDPPPPPPPQPKPATSDAKPITPPKTIEAKPAAMKVSSRDRSDDMAMPSRSGGTGTVVGKVDGASDAIVYIEDVVSPVKAAASMKQEGKQFSPQVLVVTKGTVVDFPNRDAIFHNVFSVTPDHSFDLGSYRQGETKSVTMSKAGVVTVYCNMHPQMVGHILVTPNPNWVRAGKDGFFRLPNVPAGNRRVVAWAPNAKPTVVPTEVVDGEVVTIEMSVKKGRSGTHTKKDGMPYGSYDK